MQCFDVNNKWQFGRWLKYVSFECFSFFILCACFFSMLLTVFYVFLLIQEGQKLKWENLFQFNEIDKSLCLISQMVPTLRFISVRKKTLRILLVFFSAKCHLILTLFQFKLMLNLIFSFDFTYLEVLGCSFSQYKWIFNTFYLEKVIQSEMNLIMIHVLDYTMLKASSINKYWHTDSQKIFCIFNWMP